MKISSKLFVGFVGIALLTVGVGTVSYTTNNRIVRTTESLRENIVAERRAAAVKSALLTLRDAAQRLTIEKYRGTLEQDAVANAEKAGSIGLAELDQKLNDYRELLKEDRVFVEKIAGNIVERSSSNVARAQQRQQTLIDEIEREFAVFDRLLRQHVSLIGSDLRRSDEFMRERFVPHYETRLLPLVSEYEANAVRTVETEAANIEAALDRENTIIVFSTGIALLVAFLIGIYLSNSISRPLHRLKQAALRFGGGGLDARLVVESADEIGVLGNAFNEMAEQIEVRAEKLKSFNDRMAAELAERRRAEAALSESEAEFTALAKATSQIVWRADKNGQDAETRRAWEEITGQKLIGGARGWKWLEFVHPNDRQTARENWLHAFRAKSIYEDELRVLVKSGEYRWFVMRGVPIVNDRNDLQKWVGTMSDIHQRKWAVEALLESEASYRQLADSMPQIVWTARPDGFFDYYNRRWFDYTGTTLAETEGAGWQTLVHPDDLPGCLAAWNKSVETGERFQFECRFRQAGDGAYRWHLGQARLIRDAENRSVKWFGSSTDIHEQKTIEERLRQVQEQLETRVQIRTAALERANTDLKEEIDERRRAEEKFQRSEQWLRAILDGSRDGIIIEDNAEIIYANKSYARLFGYQEPEAVIGRQITEFLPPDEALRLAEYGRRRLRGEQPPSVYEFKGKRQDKKLIEVEGAVSTSLIGGKVYIMTAIRDVSRRRRDKEELQKNLSLLTSTLEATADGILVVDRDDRIVAYNPRFVEMWQIPEEVIRARDNAQAVNFVLGQLSNADDFADTTRRLNENPQIQNFDVLEFKDGRVYERYSHPQMMGGTVVGRVLNFRDITERKRANDALRESENKFRMLIENTSEGLLQVDNDDRARFVNSRFCEMVGFAADELMDKVWTEILLGDDGRDLIEQANDRRRRGISDRYEIKLRKKSGELFWVNVGGAPMIDGDGKIVGSLGVFTDITERKSAEEQLLHDAFHDGLTGLSNRALFMDHLRLTIERCRSRHGNCYAVLFLDFDRFKIVNDSLGHAEGDKLLVQIARRLEAATRTGDLVARLGGDEFVVLLSDLVDEGEAVRVAERIQNHLKSPFDLSGSKIFISASIGIALGQAEPQSAEDLLRDADIAMYRAKTKGRAQCQVFDRSMHDQASRQLSLETEMRRALEREEFVLHYQPIINLETARLVGFEALVRWRHPERGIVAPDEFIPAAEENKLILPLGKWILQESCRQMRRWQMICPSLPPLSVSVNLSSKQFSQPDLTEQIARALDSGGLDPRCLKLEITESHVMENTETAIKTMNNLRGLGVELSLDDFGTGYSSLSYLHRLPVSYLKIDRSFVNRMIENAENGEIVSTIIKLAQNLKMKVIAEGVETAEQLNYLKKLNCEHGQGYLFSKSLEPAAALAFVEESLKNAIYETNQTVINLEQNM